MTKILIILLIAFAFEAFGVIALKKGINEIGLKYTERKAALPQWKNVLQLVGNWFTNKNVLFGLLLETIFFVLLQYLLGQRDVIFVWPLTAGGFIHTNVGAEFSPLEAVGAVRRGGHSLL